MQSKLRIFASFLLVFSLTLGLFLTLSPKGVEANNGQGKAQETCPNTGGGWIKIDDLTSKTYEYTAPTGKLVSKVCYKAANVVTYYDVVPAKEKVLVESTAINNGGQIADLSHASFLLIDKPIVEEEKHDLVLTSMCYDHINMVRVWRVFHKDKSDTYFPIQLGYKVVPGGINSLDKLFGFNHTEATRFTDPYLFETLYDEKPQTVILYWWNNTTQKWVMDDTKAANNNPCYCVKTTESVGEWSEWIVNPEDDSELIMSRTIKYYDLNDSEVLCSSKIEKQEKDRDLCPWETATYADDPLCLPTGDGEDDDGDVQGVTTEVKGTTTVVLAATAAGDRSAIYLIQSLLMLVTGISLIYVGKQYLNRV